MLEILKKVFSVIDSFIKKEEDINSDLLSEILQRSGIKLFPNQAKILKFLFQSTKKFKIVEAPTGCGKTIAYILYALVMEKFDKVIISVSTRLLQNQVIQDLKRFTEDFTVLMGKSNYVCLDKAEFYGVDLSFVPKNLREKIQVSKHYCRPEYQEKCRIFVEGKCDYFKVIEDARIKKVVIVNHSLLPYVVDILSLNSPTLLIVDECHLLPFKKVRKFHVSEEDLVEPKEPDPKSFSSLREYNIALEEYFKKRERYELAKRQDTQGEVDINYRFDFYDEVVFVSATVPQLPLNYEEVDSFSLEDKRNWSNVSIIVKDVNYRDGSYQKVLIEVVRDVMKRYDKVLVLCTSYQQLDFLKANIPECVTTKEMGAFRIVQKMRDGEIKIAAGTDVFWTGIDIPGRKAIIMTKLPFPVPEGSESDEEEFDRCFSTMFYKFKQGIGRMLRSSQCGGEIVILDNRLVGYKELVSYLSQLGSLGAHVVYEVNKEKNCRKKEG